MKESGSKNYFLVVCITILILVASICLLVVSMCLFKHLNGQSKIQDVSLYQNLTFTVIDENEKSVSVKAANSKITNAFIPERVLIHNKEYDVTAIDDQGFYDCTNLIIVEIPASIKNMGNFTFVRCVSLKNVIIPNSITNIGYYAFGECSSLISITIPESVTSIDGWAFGECSSLTSITIPNKIVSIEERVFGGCSSLKSIIIPNSVKSLGKEAFGGCSSLVSVNIPSGVTYIGEDCFVGCSQLTSINVEKGNENYKSVQGVLFSGDKKTLIQYPAGKSIDAYIIPNNITCVDKYAFYGCSNLISITIPDSVTSIGSNAFYNCSNLTSITFENTTGWHLDSTTGTSIDVSNPTTNATNLTSGELRAKYLYRE